MAEKLNIPNNVVDSEWKDDVDVDYAIYGGDEKKEAKIGLEKNKNAVVSKEAMEKIRRIKDKKIGLKVGSLLFKDYKVINYNQKAA